MNLFIINTNQKTDKRYEQEMIQEQKCAAYRSTKTHIESILPEDKVLLYCNGKGIVARGVADGRVKKKADNGENDAEYFMNLEEFYEYIKAVPYSKIRTILEQANPSFARPFGTTSLKFGHPASEIIWEEVCKYV
ncbi:hypothetical protein [Peribacillus glennii]|uniref:EVE domain-containing protein n=1 Tax=Peribacillus glennii TaxID=2303991 RepID=A0A372L7Z5_9BACI|nr:hypothetical protein [Peribacillus glennii]RFU61112.1 hypothetical protein D0466_19200 [Peribacillus glennii]